MIVTDYNEQFLDKRGTDHLIDELKAYIDNLPNGNIDLSDYVTKEELQEALRNAGVDIDLSAYATKEELTQAINSIDLSSYALKTEIPSTDGLATTEYVDNAVANIPSGGNVDLSNYYTKNETYSKTEVDTAISNIEGGGNTSSDSCALYDTVVANGGAVKEYVDKSYVADDGNKVSDVIQNIADNGTVQSGTVLFYGNPNKTTADLYNDLKDIHTTTQYIILASTADMNDFDITLYEYNPMGSKEYTSDLVGRCLFTEITEEGTGIIYLGELRVDIHHRGTKLYRRLVLHKEFYYSGSNSGVAQTIWAVSTADANCTYTTENTQGQVVNDARYSFGKLKYFTNKIYDSKTYDFIGDVSQEFTNNILNNYLCTNTVTIRVPVNYTLAEWGEKLDNSQGVDGVSPTVSITETGNGHTVSITDVNGTQSFDVTNGTNGTDGTNGTNGVSPTVTVTKEGKVATITCTDVNGTTTATISDGADGQGGSGGGSSSGITYAYDTEIATGETYFDGRPIYMRILHINPLSSAPSSYIVYDNYKKQTPFADKIISAEPLWYTTSSTQNVFTGNIIQSFTSASGSSGSAAVGAVNKLLKTVAWVQAWQTSSEFGITVTRGQDMYNYACDIFVKYVKSA